MSFQPALPLGGYAGWRFLQRTIDTQQAVFNRSPALQRDVDYFREKIGGIDTAEQLVADRRLLKVALGAYGLDADLNNRFFIRRILEDGSTDPKALGNRLADKRYLEFARAFGFGDFPAPLTKSAAVADRIARAFEGRQFEVAVGQQNEDLRLALNLRRDLPGIAARETNDRAAWFTVMGNPPLRKVFETAFGLPREFGAVDIDRQLTVLRHRAEQTFGDSSIAQFTDPDRVEKLVRRFLVQAEAQSGVLSPMVRGAAAVQLLANAGPIVPLQPLGGWQR